MELAYAAGLFDGEGCIIINELSIPASATRPKAYRRQQLTAMISMTHFPTIRALYDQFGGLLTKDSSASMKNPKHAIRYLWKVWSSSACDFLIQVEPFLITKREQAQLAIAFQRHIRECDPIFRRYKGVPPNIEEIRLHRRTLIDELQRHKAGRFDIPTDKLKSPRRKWPYAATANVSGVKVPLLL